MAEKNGKTVLVVDDEPDVRLFLRTVLEDAGFDVMLAANGKEALERVTEKKPDVISLDLVMPKMSGLKFYKYIQKNPDRADIPVVVITAHARDEFGKGDLAKIEAVRPQAGRMRVLEKPVQPEAYANAIREAAGLEALEAEGNRELKDRVAEGIRKADKGTLEQVLRILGRQS
ncbi:MAG: response regulator [bacterium]